jgi:uncharacterized membrane protein (UPF0127 family)
MLKCNNRVITEKVVVADSMLSKTLGLMFRTRFEGAMVFVLDREIRFGASMHMLLVFLSLDMVFLDADKKVVDIRRNVLPFTPWIMPKKAAKYVIEMPAGKASGMREGDQMEW